MGTEGATADTADPARLIRQAQAGDRAAFDGLAAHYRAAVVALAFSRTGDRDLAEDLAQEILVLAWRGLPALEDPAAFPAWLRQVAMNACRSWYRRTRPWPQSLDERQASEHLPDPGTGPLDSALARAEARDLRAALLMLPQANRYALVLHAWGRYTYEEIAGFLQIPPSTVDGRIRRAKARMRELLGAAAGEEFGGARPRWRKEDK